MFMGIVSRLWRGQRPRYPRWRDAKGNFCGWSRLIRNGSRALVTGLLRIAFDIRPILPWISYDAIRAIQSHLRPTSRVLEFGSGMSTIWYALHAGTVYSVEDNEAWFSRIKSCCEKYA